MISIITSIHNQLAINKLYYEALKRYTRNQFELIIIDNASDDGSTAYFESCKEVVLIRNEFNYNYPYCQNQGIKVAKYDLICFFNNDILVSPDWDVHLIAFSLKNPRCEVFSVATNDHLESREVQRKIQRRWKRIKYSYRFLFGVQYWSLKLMLRAMYGNWKKYTSKRFNQWGYNHVEGYSGSSIVAKTSAIQKIGLWDERIQAADFDIFNRVKKRSLEEKDMEAIQLILGIYFHHFQRMTVKSSYPPFHNQHQMISIEAKWGKETAILRKDIVG